MVAVVIEVLYKYIISRGWVYQPDRTNSYTIPRFLVVVIINPAIRYGSGIIGYSFTYHIIMDRAIGYRAAGVVNSKP